jgi:hypothetical protein
MPLQEEEMKKDIRRCCTGLTISDVKKEVKGLKKGKKTPKKCYLCKRPEGGRSVLLTSDEKHPFVYARIALIPVERRVTEGRVFDYFLCWECALLVGLRSKGPLLRKKNDRTREQEFPGLLPAGPAPDFYS